MVMLYQMKLLTDPDPGLSRRKRATILRGGHQKMGQHWIDQYLPLHWRTDAKTRYNHQPRRPGYIRAKRRRAGFGLVKRHGLVDNVYGGVMERMLRSQKTIRAFPTRATVVLSGPAYISLRPRDPKKPHKAKEISTVIPSEAADLTRVLGEAVTTGLNEMRAKSSKTI